MDYTLNDILKGAVVLPYDETTVNIIADATRSYQLDGDKFCAIDVMMESFLNGTVPESFVAQINTALASNETIKRLPTYILQRVALYKVCVIIDDAEDDFERTVLSSILMNYLVLYKSNFDKLPLSDVLHSFYQYHISSYLAEIDDVEVISSLSIIEKVADKEFIVNNLEDSDRKSLRMMAKESFLFRCERLLEDDIIQQEKNPFVQVYIALKKYIQEADFLYYNISMVRLLALIQNKNSTTKTMRRKLSTIVKELQPYYDRDEEGFYTSSSVILRLIQGDKVNGASTLLNKQFSLEEFAIYIYYELLLEGIIKKITK